MEKTRQQIREILAANTHHAQVEPLWTRLRIEMEEDIKARQDKLDPDNANREAYRNKKPTSRRRWPRGKPTEKKWRQGWKPVTRQTPITRR
jgi:hypothetical protein